MGAVHECGERYIHVYEGLATRQNWEWKGGFARNQVMSWEKVCTKEGGMVTYTAKRTVDIYCYYNIHLLFPALRIVFSFNYFRIKISLHAFARINNGEEYQSATISSFLH